MIHELAIPFQFRVFIAEIVYNFAAAWILALLFESPSVALDKWAWSRPGKPKLPINEKEGKLKYEDVTKLELHSSMRDKL